MDVEVDIVSDENDENDMNARNRGENCEQGAVKVSVPASGCSRCSLI